MNLRIKQEPFLVKSDILGSYSRKEYINCHKQLKKTLCSELIALAKKMKEVDEMKEPL
jgi:hypothetical protein